MANLPLAKKVAKELGVELGKVEIIRFADTEARVWMEEKVAGQNVVLLQPFSPPVDQNLVEFLLLADALRRGKPKKMVAVVPYFGYARQDKIFRPGEALSAQVVANLIEGACFEKLITIHLHSLGILDFFKIPVVHLSTASLLSQTLARLKGKNENWVAVAPDKVALAEVKKVAESFGFAAAYVEKTRDLSQKDKPKALGLVGEIKGKNVFMFDDLSSTGGTIVGGAKLLKEAGAKKVMAALTHMVVPEAAERIVQEESVDKLLITDTINYTGPKLKKMEIISVAPLLAEAIRKSI